MLSWIFLLLYSLNDRLGSNLLQCEILNPCFIFHPVTLLWSVSLTSVPLCDGSIGSLSTDYLSPLTVLSGHFVEVDYPSVCPHGSTETHLQSLLILYSVLVLCSFKMNHHWILLEPFSFLDFSNIVLSWFSLCLQPCSAIPSSPNSSIFHPTTAYCMPVTHQARIEQPRTQRWLRKKTPSCHGADAGGKRDRVLGNM